MYQSCRMGLLAGLVGTLLAACGGASTAAAPPAEEIAAPGPAEAGTEGAAAEVAPEGEQRTGTELLSGLHEGDALTYRVHRANGEVLDVRMRISRVIERGSSTAVKLSPLGTELTETVPLFPHWIIGNEEGLFGLEQHVSLTEPGFEPLDPQGQMVTEAASNVAWQIPPTWFEPAAGAFDTDPVEGWTLAGHRDHVEGTIRGERCVQLERQEGELRRRMLVCANVGMVESAMSGATDEDPYTWRLVDLGGPRSPELSDD